MIINSILSKRQVLFDEIYKFVDASSPICNHLQQEAIMIVEQSVLSNNMSFDRFDINLCIDLILIDMLETCIVAKYIILEQDTLRELYNYNSIKVNIVDSIFLMYLQLLYSITIIILTLYPFISTLNNHKN